MSLASDWFKGLGAFIAAEAAAIFYLPSGQKLHRSRPLQSLTALVYLDAALIAHVQAPCSGLVSALVAVIGRRNRYS